MLARTHFQNLMRVTPRIIVPVGRPSLVNNASSSSGIPLNEWPIDVRGSQEIRICAAFSVDDPIVMVKHEQG